jgi:hypothetical protein
MEMDDEQELMAKNSKLLTKGDATVIRCEEHGKEALWGELDPINQLAILAGLDFDGCAVTKKV